MVQQNEFNSRLIFSLIDFKRPCWKPLFKRRDIRVGLNGIFLVFDFYFDFLGY